MPYLITLYIDTLCQPESLPHPRIHSWGAPRTWPVNATMLSKLRPIPPPCCMVARRSQHPINTGNQPQPNPCASHLHECLTLDCAIINSCPLPGWPSGCCQHPVPSHHACLQSMLGQTDDRQRLQQAQPGQSVVPPNGDDA